jgi:hypothetical protein
MAGMQQLCGETEQETKSESDNLLFLISHHPKRFFMQTHSKHYYLRKGQKH